jgi:TPR repeat protein
MLGGYMKQRILLPFLLFSLLIVSVLTAQQAPDPTNARLATIAHLAALTETDLKVLLSEAQLGNAEAQYWLGGVYNDGRLAPKDAEKSASWFLKSAEQGYAPAERVVGLSFSKSDPVSCERWLLRAAEQGESEAQFWLGVAYEQTWFGTTDVQEAVKWYRKAAVQGHPDAQASLGQMYEDGEGVEQSFRLAAEWYRKAAEHVPNLGGAGQGRNQLGLLYMEGRGVPQDYVQAYFWFSLNGLEVNTSDAKSHLSLTQVRETDRLVREWKEQHRVSPEVAAALHIEN